MVYQRQRPNAEPVKTKKNVPKNSGRGDILLESPETGTWTLHCHILGHEDGGMMMHVDVEE